MRARPITRILALAAAVALAPAAALAASTGGTTVPIGSTGLTGPSGAGGPARAPGDPRAPRRSRSRPQSPRPPQLGDGELSRLRGVMRRAMTPLGTHSGAYAVDLATGQVLLDDAAATPRNPASVEKLYTLTTALVRFGVNGRLWTRIYGEGRLERGGVFVGDLYLRGGGDPTFGDATFDQQNYGTGTTVGALARLLIERTHIRRVDGSVIGDESYFDSLRGEPASHYQVDPDLVGELSALAFDRGETGTLGSPAAYAAHELAGQLRLDGVVVTGHSSAGVTDLARAHPLARIGSPPMSVLVRLTALPSDNYFAEMLLKGLGARFGASGTTAAGAAVVRHLLARLHLTPSIVDGSGLSRMDRTSPRDVVTLLADLSPGGVPRLQRVGVALRAALPVVSEDGTLEYRMPHTVASGRCEAKSGTLSDASDLAGWCNGEIAFAFLMNHVDVTAAQHAQDLMTIALAKVSAQAASAAPPRR